MNMYGRIEGAPLRQRTTFNFELAPPPPRASGVDLSYVRASALAQVRLQLAVLSGNRRGALREVDRLVEIDRRLEAIGKNGPAGQPAHLEAELDEQREAIACEKLALMAAVEFPRLAPAERSEEPACAAEADEIVVVEDSEFGGKVLRALWWVLGIVAVGTALSFAAPPLLAML